MTASPDRRAPRERRRRLLAAPVIATLAIGVVAGVTVFPGMFSNAASTAVSTVTVAGSDLTNASTATGPAASQAATTGTARPGDRITWRVAYQNNTTAPAAVDVKDLIGNAGTFVPGSLQLPPNANATGTITPRYTTDGSTWASGQPPANATGLGYSATLNPQGTQALSATFTGLPPTGFSISGGDSYNIVVRNHLVYTVFHHSPGPAVYCAQYDRSTCPGWPSGSNVQHWSATLGSPIGTGTPFAGRTPQQNGTWLWGDRLYWYAGLTNNASAGIACLDLAPSTPVSCGYTARALSPVDNVTYAAAINGTGIPASNGNNYAVANSNGQAIIVCTTPSLTSCPGATLYASGTTSNSTYSSATFGDYVFASVQKTSASSWQTFCFDTQTAALCPGSWPATTSATTAKAGTPFAPNLSTTGALVGVCTIPNGAGTSMICHNMDGTVSPVTVYYATGAIFSAGGNGTGDVLVRGTKVYISNGNQVMCRDFALRVPNGAAPPCAGYTPAANNVNYTVRDASEYGPDCLVATGDAGQITVFDAATGAACAGSSSPQTVGVSPLAHYCGSGAASFTGWNALSLVGLASTSFTTATVVLRDQNGAVIPGYSAYTLAAGGSLGLASLPASVTALSVTVTLNGVKNSADAARGLIQVTWNGGPSEMCFETIVPPVSCDAASVALFTSATAVTTSPAGSDAPGGNSSGVAQFDVRAADDQCALLLEKTSSTPSAFPGDTVTYSISIRNTGTQAYDSARLTDDLVDVLRDARYNADATATAGTVSYSGTVLSWTGRLLPSEVVTITYSVTITIPAAGDRTLVNTVASPSRGTNCGTASSDTACSATVVVNVLDVAWRKVDATVAANILPGSAWTFTPVDAAGRSRGAPIAVTDCEADDAEHCTGADIDPIGGTFQLTGLGPGTYHLVETRAPAGYVLNPMPIPVTLTDTSTTVRLPDIVNEQQTVPFLPFTGGVGSDTFTLTGGGVLVLVAGMVAVQFLRRRRAM